MGCFHSTKPRTFSNATDRLCQYPRSARIPIKLRSMEGNIVGTQNISFNVTEPLSITSKEIELQNEKVLISSCILPGFDPRGEYKKKCQDNCFYLYDSECILCCLFDGHGQEGEKVAEFCQKIIEKMFAGQKNLLKVVVI